MFWGGGEGWVEGCGRRVGEWAWAGVGFEAGAGEWRVWKRSWCRICVWQAFGLGCAVLGWKVCFDDLYLMTMNSIRSIAITKRIYRNAKNDAEKYASPIDIW